MQALGVHNAPTEWPCLNPYMCVSINICTFALTVAIWGNIPPDCTKLNVIITSQPHVHLGMAMQAQISTIYSNKNHISNMVTNSSLWSYRVNNFWCNRAGSNSRTKRTFSTKYFCTNHRCMVGIEAIGFKVVHTQVYDNIMLHCKFSNSGDVGVVACTQQHLLSDSLSSGPLPHVVCAWWEGKLFQEWHASSTCMIGCLANHGTIRTPSASM